MIATIKVYGADTTITSDPIVTAVSGVQGLAGVVSAPLEVDWVKPSPEYEGKKGEYLGNYNFNINAFRYGYNIVTSPKDFPTADTDFLAYLPLTNVFSKRYVWVDFNDYKLNMYSGQDGTNCLRVNIDDFKLVHEGGQKHFEITLKDLKQNGARS